MYVVRLMWFTTRPAEQPCMQNINTMESKFNPQKWIKGDEVLFFYYYLPMFTGKRHIFREGQTWDVQLLTCELLIHLTSNFISLNLIP